MQYPKKIEDNFAFRAWILSKAKHDKQFEAAILKIVREDILFWINTFCWIYDAKGDVYKKLGFTVPDMLFITWTYEDDYILKIVDRIKTGQDELTEKSRDMGVSWMILTIFLWFFLFQGIGNDFLLGSRKEDYVDKQGVMSALFPKLRYQLKRQPQFLMPLGFNWKVHDNYMRLLNPENKNYIQGEANNDVFGSGGRYKADLKDEFAKWKHTDAMAWQSTSDTTNCRLAVSSAFGRNNHFYKLRSGKAGKISVSRLHWKMHPLKDQAWYDAEKLRRSPEDLAAEVDIDYSASIIGRAYGSFKYDIHCAEPYPEYNPNLPISLECDFNINPMSWALCHEKGGDDFYFDEIVIKGDTRTEYTAIEFRDRFKNHKNKELIIYGDATGKHGSTKAKHSDYQIIERMLSKRHIENGWQIVKQVRLANPPVRERINATNKRLCDWENDNKNHIHINPVKCPTIVDSFEQTQRKGDGIDKTDNIEHITDGIGYKQEYKYSIKRRKIRGII